MNRGILIVIPAYKPDERLIKLVRDLKKYKIVVVDDGSGAEYDRFFENARTMGAVVLRYGENLGKGHALKVAFRHIWDAGYPAEWIITVDADGQHKVRDVERMVLAADSSSALLLIGVRRFAGYVPFRSRAGNLLASWMLKRLTGIEMKDTQSGLRAYRCSELPFFGKIAGERYEYEMNCLMECCRNTEEIPIETVYEKGNGSSHYRVVTDTARIWRTMLRFAESAKLEK